MLHGEAISLGMRAALFLSERHAGLAPEASAQNPRVCWNNSTCRCVLPPAIATETVMEKLARDKKFAAGAIRFVVLDAPGSARVTDAITPADLREAIEHLR